MGDGRVSKTAASNETERGGEVERRGGGASLPGADAFIDPHLGKLGN